jgi:acetyl esterase/lipase
LYGGANLIFRGQDLKKGLGSFGGCIRTDMINIEQRINKDLKAHFLGLPEVDDISSDSVGIRQFMAAFTAMENAKIPENDQVVIEDRMIPSLNKGPDIPVRIYSPVSKPDNMPGLLWFHGGGFILGNLDTDHHWCATIAHEVQCTVVSVDYRLAPEHPFPAGIEDCYSALIWMASSAQTSGIDTKRIGAGGVSAGGNMTAALALMARDKNGPELLFQFLVYPCLDDRHTTPSSFSVTNKRVWHRQMALKAWDAYLGKTHKKEVSCYAAPARAKDLSGLPPAYITAAELDLLRDEDIEYAKRLMQADVSTELHVFPGVIHGFEFFFQNTDISKQARSEYLDFFKNAFG